MLPVNPKRFIYDKKQDRYFCFKDQAKQLYLRKQEGFMQKVIVKERIFASSQVLSMVKSKQQRFRNPLNQNVVNLTAIVHKQHSSFIERTSQENCQDIVLLNDIYCTLSLQPLTNNHNLLKIGIFDPKSFSRLNSVSIKILGMPNITKVIKSTYDQMSKSSRIQMLFCTSYFIRLISYSVCIKEGNSSKMQFITDLEKQIEAIDQAQVSNERIYFIKQSRLGIIELNDRIVSQGHRKVSKKLSSMHFKQIIRIKRGIALITKCLHIVIIDSQKKTQFFFRTGILLDQIFLFSETTDKISFLVLSGANYKLLEIPWLDSKNSTISQPIFQNLPFINSEKGFKIVQSQILYRNSAIVTFQQLKSLRENILDKQLIICFVTSKQGIVECYQIMRCSTDGYHKVLLFLLKSYEERLLQQSQNKNNTFQSEDFDYLFFLK